MRIAVLDRELCIKDKCGFACEKVCPVNRMGKECIVIDKESGFPIISEELCIGCNICVKKCPGKAIDIINLPSEEGVPVYQYGINSFRVYSLPIPKPGISSFIGRNGLGKTTVLKLLTGSLTPQKELGIEARTFLKQNKSKSIKPQNIEALRELPFTVKDLINKYNETNNSSLLDKLSLKPILDRKLNQLSGGELQRVAIAVAMLREADLYYFDEISNYLDIGERLNIAILLKNFNRDMVVVEHDLALLDYLSETIYIFYGKPNSYAFVSSAKGTRVGINEYLEGFLKEENVKFREPLRLSALSLTESHTESINNYPSFSFSVGSFSLRAEQGDIRKGEVVGIVGKNALGKSLFVSYLANHLDLKLAYKEQYLKRSSDIVSSLFKDADRARLEKIKHYLAIDHLFEQELNNLSGGELQLVKIAETLSKQADIYLLDEPTAFLDIENRLALAKLINSLISSSDSSAFVVDHDLVFLDAIASRLIVFEGKQGIKGFASSPLDKKQGFNKFLASINITVRRDKDSKRPKINKPGSVLDREQRKENNYFA